MTATLADPTAGAAGGVVEAVDVAVDPTSAEGCREDDVTREVSF
jgi:hypothetical protein